MNQFEVGLMETIYRAPVQCAEEPPDRLAFASPPAISLIRLEDSFGLVGRLFAPWFAVASTVTRCATRLIAEPGTGG
jgi:hypothetical protein